MCAKRIATIGFFDGVHRGHQSLFTQLQQLAYERGEQALICTFDEHPLGVLMHCSPPLLTLREERMSRLQNYAEVAEFPFSSIQSRTAEQFMRTLNSAYDVHTLLMGYDHRFGSDRLVSIADYRAIANRLGMEVILAEAFAPEGVHISSSQIRSLLVEGKVEDANEMLGYTYQMTGVVVHGNGIGRQLGFPTANISVPESKLLPKRGVYATEVVFQNDAPYAPKQAISNIGTNPTIGNSHISVETYIPEFDGDLYQQTITVKWKQYLREEHHFESSEALQEQIRADILQLNL